MTEKKQDVWDMTVLQKVTLRVCFDKELTAEEAIDALLDEEFDEISDERDPEIRGVLSVE